MKLNVDLGESFGQWRMGQDSELMPWVDQANIACGFHAGDPSVMQHTVTQALAQGVMLGAHPGYPDLQGFGRRAMQVSANETVALILYQVGALQALAQMQGASLSYVKPHGALYHALGRQEALRLAVMEGLAAYNRLQATPLALMLPAGPGFVQWQAEADNLGLVLWAEAFADRAYDNHCRLVDRSQSGAILPTLEQRVAQALAIWQQRPFLSHQQQPLVLRADSLCIHGDDPLALATVQAIRAAYDAL